MRCLTRMGRGLGLLALALVVPTAAWADPPPSNLSSTANPPANGRARLRRSLFHRPHLCARCQWSDLRARGIDAPPPPALPQPPPGSFTSSWKTCDRCGGIVATTGAAYLPIPPSPAAPPPGPRSVPMMAAGYNCVACAGSDSAPLMVANGGMPGRAVAGGDAPGYMAVGGTAPTAEPVPIGTIQGRYAYQDQGAAGAGPGMGMTMPGAVASATAGAGAGAGARGPRTGDPSVRPSSFSAEPITPGHNRPHILTHLFGLDALGQHARQERERRARENHASISYQPMNQQVNELPASVVYGR